MFILKKSILILTGWLTISTGLYAADLLPILTVDQNIIDLKPGQTIEIPLHSSAAASGDLAANGYFQNGDVTLTDGPGCHLTAESCTLIIHASPLSQDYTNVPVVVSESAVSNMPIIWLSVTHPGKSALNHESLPAVLSTPIILSTAKHDGITFTVTNTRPQILTNVTAKQLPEGVTSSVCGSLASGATCTLKLIARDISPAGHFVIPVMSDQGNVIDRILVITTPPRIPSVVKQPLTKPIVIQRSGNSLFYGTVELHPSLLTTTNGSMNGFTTSTNGPSYQIVSLTNNDVTQPLSFELSGPGVSHFSIDSTAADYGDHDNCAALSKITHGSSCLFIVKGLIGDPGKPPETATLTLRGQVNNVAKFKLTTTTYVYVGGGFTALGDASVSGGELLAECTAGTCSNALQGTTGNNYASTSSSPGDWINTIIVTSNGNLEVGGGFGAIGGVPSTGCTNIGTGFNTYALLAQCTPGATTGNACINQINTTGSLNNACAVNEPYINALTPPVNTSGTTYFMFLGGDFYKIRGFSAADIFGRLSAKCQYATSGTGQSATCNFIPGQYFDNAITAINYDGTNLEIGGLFANYYYPSQTAISRLAQCVRFGIPNTAGNCTAIVSPAPNNTVLGITNNGSTLYIGGAFTQIGGYVDSSGGYPLVTCAGTSPDQTCTNALSGDANNYIEGLAYLVADGKLYVGGKFTSISGATPTSGPMLAVCTIGGTCDNFVTATGEGNHPYASGGDFGSFIGAIAIGTRSSAIAE